MKTKTFSIIILVLALPTFLHIIVIGSISFEYFMFGSSQMWEQLGSGKLNYGFLTILSGSAILFIGAVAGYCMEMLKHAGKIDKLEEETKKHREAKEKYEKAAKEFTDKFLNGK